MTRPTPIMKSELDLFDTVKMQNNYTGYTVERISSVNGGSNPLEFKLSGSSSEYVWPKDHYLYMQIVLRTAADAALAEGDKTTLVNNFAHTLWSDVKVTINGTQITQKEENYAYKSYLMQLLSYGDCAINSQGLASMFIKDTAGHMDALDATNKGAQARQAKTAQSKKFEVMAPLNIDLFQAGKVLPNGCDIRIKLTRNKPEFCLMIPDGTGRFIDIKKAELVIVKPKIDASTALAHAAAFQRTPALYPIRRTEIQTSVIEKGVRSKNFSHLCQGQLPRRLFVGFVNNDAYNGNRELNPFKFEHFNLSYLALMCDGELRPNIPLTPDYANDLYLESYMSLFTSTGKYKADEGIIITPEEFANGYAIYGFDLSSDLSSDSRHFDIIKSGNFKMEMKFSVDTPAPINAVILMEFDSVIRIDRSRSIITDYS